MIQKTHLLVALTALSFGGSAKAVDYSNEDFEGGTPNYNLTGSAGSLALTQLLDGSNLVIGAATALANTDYTPGSPTRSGVWANNNMPTAIANEPAGQHGFVSTSANRNLTLNPTLTLLQDGVATLNIAFDTMVYGRDADFTHVAAIYYSASGDFTDAQLIATYAPAAVANPGGQVLGHYIVTEDAWSNLQLSISSSQVTFTDTAKIRFNKLAPNVEAQMVFYDNIVISGQTAPAPAAPFMATIAPAVAPNTGYDLQWTSKSGTTYSVLSSTDLASPVDNWTVVQAGIAPTPPQNSYNVPADGPRRFYVIRETTP